MQMSLLISLPKELIIDCLARVPICYYSTLSLVSKLFRSIIASPQLYTRRSLLNCHDHECYIYVSMFSPPTEIHWYVLDRKTLDRSTTHNSLLAIPSLPSMCQRSSLAVVGSKIFVMGGCGSDYESSVFLIDCPSNTWQLSGSMPRPVTDAHSDIVDGKIYVVEQGKIIVFDPKKQMWEELGTIPNMEMGIHCRSCVGMSGRIYIKTNRNSLIYEPNEGKWEMDEILDSKNWKHACVVDDVLYYHEVIDNKLRAYDSKEKSWKVVKGVERMHESWSWSCMTSHCGKLVLFLQKVAHIHENKEIWGAEIAVEKREGGEIWGTFEWFSVVLSAYLDDCVAVSV